MITIEPVKPKCLHYKGDCEACNTPVFAVGLFSVKTNGNEIWKLCSNCLHEMYGKLHELKQRGDIYG